MRLPRSFEIPGLFRFRLRLELDGQEGRVDLASGQLSLRLEEHEVVALSIGEDVFAVDVAPWLARRMLKQAGAALGWLNLMQKGPASWRAMQRLADESGARVEFRVHGRPLVTFRPGGRPSFSLQGLKSFLAD